MASRQEIKMGEQATIVTDVTTLKPGDRIRHSCDGLDTLSGTVKGYEDGMVLVDWDDMTDIVGRLNLDPFFGTHTVELIG
jgi:hypothetical protein